MYKHSALTHNQLRSLVERFLDGDTTPAQEKALYNAFANAPTGSLPDDLEANRAMLSWFDNYSSGSSRLVKKNFFKRFRFAGVACALVLFVGIGLFLAKSGTVAANPLVAQYSGSYIIENGKKISDVNKFLDKIIDAERLVDSIENVAAAQEYLLLADYDVQLVESTLSNVADPELAAILKNELLGETSANN